MKYDLNTLEEKIVQWSDERGILKNGKSVTQCLKLMSELGELADNLAKGNNCEDDIGDCLVVLTNIARLEGTTLVKCGNKAYEDIKDRKGFLNANGNFIKSTDKNYEKLYAEFLGVESSNSIPEVLVINLKQKDFTVSPFVDEYDYTLTLSDGSTYDIKITPEFMEKYPEPPFGKPLSFWVKSNDK
jgi:NTP pyrophosphatase (non-canonical NTP hydrolase)